MVSSSSGEFEIDLAVDETKCAGASLLGEKPGDGMLFAFVHPSSQLRLPPPLVTLTSQAACERSSHAWRTLSPHWCRQIDGSHLRRLIDGHEKDGNWLWNIADEIGSGGVIYHDLFDLSSMRASPPPPIQPIHPPITTTVLLFFFSP